MPVPQRHFALLSLIFMAGGALADAPRAVTHEDVWLMKRLGTPAVSPDGTRAVVSVTEPSYDKDGTVSDLWLVDVAGDAEPLRLTSSREGESDVDWSPDGSRIAFSAAREQDQPAQIYVQSMVGPGEAVKITSLSTGAAAPKWSPDGKRIAFESRVYPGAADDAANAAEKKAREEREYNVSAYEIFPIRHWDHWRDDLQVHLFVQDAAPGATATDLMFGSELVNARGYSGVPGLSSDSLNAEWTPDGQSLLVNATTNLDEAAHAEVLYHLWKVSADGSGVAPLTTSDEWSCHGAMFSRDGRALYCLIEPNSGSLYNLTEIGRFDWTGDGVGGAPTIITASFDRSVDGMDLSTNDRIVYLTALDAGRSRIYSVNARGGEVSALDEGSAGVYSGAAVAGNRLVARWESSATPAEIVRVDSRSGRHEPLTRFNTERAAELDRPPFDEFWFENANGLRVHSYVTLPPAFDPAKKYPLVLMIHGGPFASSLDADHVRWSPYLLAAPGYVVLQTDYTGSVGYGAAFSNAIEGTPLKAPGDDVLQALDEALARYDFIDGERLAATGASYGGHLINWLQATTTRFDALVGHAGLVDLEGQYTSSDTVYSRERMNGGPPWEDIPVWKEQSPSSYVGNFQTPILLTIGEKDFRVPINQTISAWTYVQRMQVPGRLLVFHDANHWVMKGAEARYYWQEVHQWLASHIGPGPDEAPAR